VDFNRREQLISRGFLKYLLDVFSNGGKVGSNVRSDLKNSQSISSRMNTISWEGKLCMERSMKKDTAMLKDFSMLLQSFDKLVSDLKERMKLQYESVHMKMKSVMNNRDNDINKRKVTIHKKLAKYVNKECNNR
jgi:ElaB/YqjD/DUF883 family membrane-anchored ribosome-binding protein